MGALTCSRRDSFWRGGCLSNGLEALPVEMIEAGYADEWVIGIMGYLYCAFARLADRNSEICTWQVGSDKIGHTFARFALPITWDFVGVMPWADASRA